MKKGFTLVELITVIALISIISVFTLPNIISKIKEQSNQLDSQLENMLISSASLYVDNSERILKNKMGTCISVKKLINVGYLDKSILNSYDGKIKENTNILVTFENDTPKYSIDYNNFCNAGTTSSTMKTKDELSSIFWDDYSSKIEAIYTQSTIPVDKYTAVGTNNIYDISNGGDKSVLAWLEDSDSDELYELYLAQNGGVKAPTDCTGLFSYIPKVEIVDLSNFDTSNVTNMKQMFQMTGSDAANELNINLTGSFDTGKVTSMYSMFSLAGHNTKKVRINFGNNFDTHSVTNMAEMFFSTASDSEDFELSINFNPSNVTNMNRMFGMTCENAKHCILDLGDNFDTHNVTDMNEMFSKAGKMSEYYEFSLGDKFDTSKVYRMQSMFDNFFSNATTSTTYTLDLGEKFNTSKVTSMSAMFENFATKLPQLTFDLGPNFNTKKVEDMYAMFQNVAHSATAFTFDLGDQFYITVNPLYPNDPPQLGSMFNGMGTTGMTLLDLGSHFTYLNEPKGFYYENIFLDTGKEGSCVIKAPSIIVSDANNFKTTLGTKIPYTRGTIQKAY